MQTVSTRAAALSLPRLLIVLSLAATLVAIPAVAPEEAGAMRMSERRANQLCANAGGSMYYDFVDADAPLVYNMTCTLPSGASFGCSMTGGMPFGDVGNCQ